MLLPSHLIHELTIKSLLIRERYYRDSAQWDKLRQSWHPEANTTSLKISWFTGPIDAFVTASQRMLASGTLSTHTIQPAEVEINGNKAIAASTGSVSVRAAVEGVEYEMVSLVRFHSRLVHCCPDDSQQGAWKLVSLEAVYDRDYVIPTARSDGAQANPRIEVAVGARESYKYLEWMLGNRGFAIARDLPGLDDESSVRKVMDEAQEWLWKDRRDA
ncbi:hypothetical protein MBLNU13_g06085t1 [Cladosporium sp. NU13]